MCNWKGRSAAGVPAAPMTDGTMCTLPTPSIYTTTMHPLRIATLCKLEHRTRGKGSGKRWHCSLRCWKQNGFVSFRTSGSVVSTTDCNSVQHFPSCSRRVHFTQSVLNPACDTLHLDARLPKLYPKAAGKTHSKAYPEAYTKPQPQGHPKAHPRA